MILWDSSSGEGRLLATRERGLVIFAACNYAANVRLVQRSQMQYLYRSKCKWAFCGSKSSFSFTGPTNYNGGPPFFMCRPYGCSQTHNETYLKNKQTYKLDHEWATCIEGVKHVQLQWPKLKECYSLRNGKKSHPGKKSSFLCKGWKLKKTRFDSSWLLSATVTM